MTEVKGFGRQKGHTEIYRGSEYTVDFLPKIKIELVLPDNRLDAAVGGDRQSRQDRQNRRRQGVRFSVENAIRIRTDEKGDLAV